MKNFDKIVTFGDSFAWGDELIAPDQVAAADYANRFYREQKCYTGILAEHYGVASENLAFPGGSCQSTRWIYTWWRQQEPNPMSCLVLVQLSGPWRTSQFDRHRARHETDPEWNQFIHSSWVDYYRTHHKQAYDYFRLEHDLADSDQRNNMVQAETYLFFQGQQSQVGLVLMFNSQTASLDHTVRPKSLAWPDACLQTLLPQKHLWAPNGHLNKAGHEMAAEMLIQEIDRVILDM